MRMRVPQLISERDELNVSPKDDDDQMMGRKDDNKMVAKQASQKLNKAGAKIIYADIEWEKYTGYYEKVPREKLINAIAAALLQTNTAVGAGIIKQYSDESSRETFIRTATIQLMSTPEYQLC